MNIKQAKKIFEDALEKLQQVQDELEVEFPLELAPDTEADKFFEQLQSAINDIENCNYDLEQLEGEAEQYERSRGKRNFTNMQPKAQRNSG